MDKQRSQRASMHWKGPEIPFNRILMTVIGVSTCGEVCMSGILKIGNWKCFFFACRATTGDAMAKWMLRLDSTCQKGLETPLHEISDCSGDASTGGEVCWGRILKIGQGPFCLWSHNLLCYVKMDGTAGFGSSNWSRTHFPRLSNGRWLWFYCVEKKVMWCPTGSGTVVMGRPIMMGYVSEAVRWSW